MDLTFFAIIAAVTLLGLAALQWGSDSRESSDPSIPASAGLFQIVSR